MIPERLAPSRPINRPSATLPASAAPVVMHNNTQLVRIPNLPPPPPAITSPLTGTGTGFQFSFNQVTVPTGATNVISGYKVYRNTANFQPGATLVATYPHTPARTGPIVHNDHLLTSTGQSYYYWVTSVDNTGQESSPNAAQNAAVSGSAGSTPFSKTSSFAYTATSTSITWYWDGTNGSTAITIYRADNTTTGPISGNQAITGLNPSTTYNFYPYWHEPSKSIKWVAGGSGSPAYAQPSAGGNVLVQQQNLRNQIPLSLGGMQASTPGSGSGSGTGGGGGGGGGCFTGNVGVKTLNGIITFDQIPEGEIFQIENETGIHAAKLIVHRDYHEEMIDMGGGKFVTFGHHVKSQDGRWIPAISMFPACPTVDFTGTVYNLSILSEKDADHHYILESGIIAHNVLLKE